MQIIAEWGGIHYVLLAINLLAVIGCLTYYPTVRTRWRWRAELRRRERSCVPVEIAAMARASGERSAEIERVWRQLAAHWGVSADMLRPEDVVHDHLFTPYPFRQWELGMEFMVLTTPGLGAAISESLAENPARTLADVILVILKLERLSGERLFE